MAIEQLRRGVEQGAALGEARDVDQTVDAAKAFDRVAHDDRGLGDVRDIGGREGHLSAGLCCQLGGEGLTDLAASAGEGDVRTRLGRGTRDGGTQTLGAAADQDDLAREVVGPAVVGPRHQTSSVRRRVS